MVDAFLVKKGDHEETRHFRASLFWETPIRNPVTYWKPMDASSPGDLWGVPLEESCTLAPSGSPGY